MVKSYLKTMMYASLDESGGVGGEGGGSPGVLSISSYVSGDNINVTMTNVGGSTVNNISTEITAFTAYFSGGWSGSLAPNASCNFTIVSTQGPDSPSVGGGYDNFAWQLGSGMLIRTEGGSGQAYGLSMTGPVWQWAPVPTTISTSSPSPGVCQVNFAPHSRLLTGGNPVLYRAYFQGLFGLGNPLVVSGYDVTSLQFTAQPGSQMFVSVSCECAGRPETAKSTTMYVSC